MMIKRAVALLLLLGATLLSQPLFAADKTEDSVTLWEKLRKKIYMLMPQKKLDATTAVGGVRGAPSDASDIYWKGEANQQVDAEELTAFKKAMALVDAGDMKQAQTAFADFVKNHPDSSLRKDADQALALLQTDP